MNQINLIGRLTKTPELRATPTGKFVSEFNIAVNRIGNENADFITCQVWEKQAENLCKYQTKGSLIGVSGSLRVDVYQDSEGNNKYKTYVLANNIEYLSSKSESTTTENSGPVVEETNEEDPYKDFGNEVVLTDDDLPF